MSIQRVGRLRDCGHILVCLLVWMAGSAAAQAPPEPKKFALLIGLNQYLSISEGVPTLKYATVDVVELGDILQKRGYEVTVRLNEKAEREDIVSELYRFAHILNENDTFLLFFAGHGVRNRVINSETYWLTYDAQLRVLDVSGIRLRHLLDYVRDIKAKRKLILLDHCFSGDVVRAGSTTESGPRGLSPAADTTMLAGPPPLAANSREGGSSVGIARNVVPLGEIERQIRTEGEGMVVIAAARDEALESEQLKHGVFSSALCKAFSTRAADTAPDAKLSIDELKAYLKAEVPRLALQVAYRKQLIVESTQGTDLTGWVIADNLPLGNLAEAQKKVRDYENKIVVWEIKRWISYNTKLYCKDALSKWIESQENGASLDERSQRIFEEIRKHIEETNHPEDLRARDLDDVVQVLVQT